MTTVTIERCATPGCVGQRGAGLYGRFCEPCATNLGRIRDELSAVGYNVSIGCVPDRGRSPKVPVCSSPYCGRPREHGHAFCEECEDAGYVEEAA